MKEAFSHRSKDGISVGVVQQDNKLFLAIAMTNTGVSLSGKIDNKKHDTFSRKRAQQILRGRLSSAIQANALGGSPPKMTYVLDTSISSRQFIQGFRKLFKPDPHQNDFMFNLIASETVDTILEMAKKTIGTP